MTDRPRRVILLIDYDNLQICASRDTPGRELQLDPVVQLAQRYGTVLMARAYAEWNLSTERLAVYKAGIEPAFAPVLRTESDRSGKSLADTVMVAEGMDMLWTLQPEVLVMATSDKDLIPLARVAKQRGLRVVVLGSDFTAIPLREMADEHITYKQLITDGAVRAVENAAIRGTLASTEAPIRRGGREREQRPDREVRQPREPREERAFLPPLTTPVAVQTAPAAPLPGLSFSQPAVPDTAAAEGDALAAGRRRRRRGSRRRADRLPGTLGDEAGQTEFGSDDDDAPSSQAELTGTSADDETAAANPDETNPARPLEDFAAASPAPDAVGAEQIGLLARPTTAQGEVREPFQAVESVPDDAVAATSNGQVSPGGGSEAGADVETTRPRVRRVASASRGRTRPPPR